MVFFVALSAHSVNVILSEGFENGIPTGWTQEKVTGNANFDWTVEDATQTSIAPQGAAEGTYRVAMRNPNTAPKSCTMRLITPVMDCSGYLPRLSFAHAQPPRSSKNAQLKIYYRSSQADEWTLMTSYADAISDWQRDTMNLVAPNNTYQLAFEAVVTTAGGGYGVVLDDIHIETTPQCTDVQGLGIVPMANSAELTIGDLSAMSFQVVVTTTPVTDWESFNPATATYYDPNVLDLVVTITGLQPQTDYYAYVRSACADLPSGYTNWVSESFRTSIAFPFTEDFESSSTLPEGWQRYSGSLSDAYAGTPLKTTTGGWTYSGNATVTGSSHVYGSTSTSATYWLMMPAIDLTAVHVDTMIDLEFYLALTGSSTSASAVSNKSGLNFHVLVSEDAGQSWSAANTTTWSASPNADYDINGVMNVPSRYRVNMNRYKGQVVQVAFVTNANSGSGYFHVDDVVLASYDPQCGDAAKLQLSTDMNAVTANWTMYGKENAVIEIATDNAFTAKVDSAVITTGTTYTFTNLTSNTVYYVRVKQDCPDASWVYGSCRTVIGMPYLNPFTSSSFPTEWSRDNTGISLQQLLSGSQLALSSSSGWTMASNSTSFPNMGYRAYTNIWSNNVHNWMVTPAIKLTDNSNDPIRLSFMAALSKSSSSATAPVFSETDQDDVFAVLISQDGGLTWLAADAHIWDTDTASTNPKLWAFSEVPQKISIDLTQYRSQTVRIAFYGGSTSSGSDNYMMIGSLSINTFDANCGGVSGLSVNTTPTTATATWSTRGYPEVNVELSKVSSFATLVDSAVVSNGTILFSNLETSTQYYLRVRQQCSTDDSEWATTSFKTPVGLPFNDPLTSLSNWTKMSGKVVDAFLGTNPTSTTSGWTVTSRHIDGISNDSHASYNLWSTSNNYWLVSDPINMYVENGDPIQLEFDFGITPYSSTSTTVTVTNQMLWVLVSTDNGASWTRANSYLISAADSADYNIENCAGQAVHFKLPLTQYTGQTIQLAFAANQYVTGGDNYVHLANISIHTIDANCQGLTKLRATNVTGTSADIEWVAGGEQSLDITIATDTAYSQVVYTGSITGTYSLTNLTPNTRYYVKARQTCDTESDWTKMMFKTLCSPQTPAELGLMTFDEAASLDCWTLGFLNPGSSTANAHASYGHGDTYGYGIMLDKRSVNSGETTYSDGAYAISPELNLGTDSINKYQVTFNAFTFSTVKTNVARLNVGIVTSPDQLDTYERIKTIPLEYAADSTEAGTYVVSFADYIGDYNEEYGKYIMFMSEAGDSMTNYVFIDNVIIEPAAGCPMLIETVMDSVEANTAIFGWENSNATSYEVVVATVNAAVDSIQPSAIAFQSTVTTNSVHVTGLMSNMRYYAYVRAVCTEDNVTTYSRWSGARSFKTACDKVNNYPWIEGFEDYDASSSTYSTTNGIIPDCWMSYTTGTVAPHIIGSGSYLYIHEGAQAMSFYGSGSNYAVLPAFDAPIRDLEMTFWMQTESASNGTLTLGYIMDENASLDSAFIELQEFERHNGSMIQCTADLGTVPVAAKRLVFRWVYSSQWSVCIDDIVVNRAPACRRPAIVSTVPTLTSMQVNWVGNGASYELQYSLDQTFATANTLTITGDSTATITGLTPSTVYYLRVRGLCGVDGESEWSNTTAATTVIGVPYTESFNHSSLPDGWEIYSGWADSVYMGQALEAGSRSTTYTWTNYTSNYGLDPNHLGGYIYGSTSSNYGQQWFISPSIDMTANAGDSLIARFNMALTSSSSSAAPTSSYYPNFDIRFMVSADDGMTWTKANSWIWRANDTTAYAEPTSIPVDGRNSFYSFDLSRFGGNTIRLAFYFDYTAQSTGYARLHIANLQLIKLVPNCNEPVLEVPTADVYTATFNWQGDSAKTSVIQTATTPDFSANVRFDTVPAGLTATITGLNAASTYYARVKQLCGGTDESVYSATQTFNTACIPMVTFPWIEDFEGTPTTGYRIPNCWDRLAYVSSSTVYPYVYNSTTYASSGSHVIYMSGGVQTATTNSSQAIILPEIGVNPQLLEISFYHRQTSTTDAYPSMVLGTMTDPTDASTFVVIDTLPKVTSKTLYRHYLNDVDSTARYIAIALGGGTSSTTATIDDIKLDYIPACPDILHVGVMHFSATEVAVIPESNAANYRYLLTDARINMAEFDSVAQSHVLLDTIGTDTMVLNTLQPSTTYYVYVQGLCSETEISKWSDVIPFTTSCYAISLPYVEGFESYEGGSYSTVMDGPACWLTATTSSVAPHVISNTADASHAWPHSGDKALSFYGAGTNYAVLPLFSTPINMMRISFWMQTESATTGTLTLGYITNDDVDMNSYTVIETFANNTNSTVQRMVDLTEVPIPANAARLVFRWVTSTTWYLCSVDDIQITERPSNETLLGVAAANVSRTSMDIVWEPRPDSTICRNYEVIFSDTAVSAANLDSVPSVMIADTNVYHVASLERNTMYYFYVRTVCGNDYGLWVSNSAKTKPLQGCDINDITSESTTDNSSLPTNSYYNYSVTQQIYTPAEIGSAGPIGSIAFYNAGTAKTRDIEVYLMHTTKNEFSSTDDWVAVSATDLVFAGEVTFEADVWNTLPLIQQFNYNGTDNLLLVMDDNTGSYSQGMSCLAFSTGSVYQALYKYQDGSDMNPMDMSGITGTRSISKNSIRLETCYTLEACPAITGITSQLQGDGTSEALISWAASNADYAGSYDLFITDNDSIVPDSVNVPQYTNLTDTFVVVNGLVADEIYHVFVRVHCNAQGHEDGDSEWADATFTTLSTCPAVQNLQAVLTSKTSAEVTWDPAYSGQPADYRYIISTTPMNATELETAVPATDTTLHLYLTDLTMEQQYWVYVASACTDEMSAYEMVTFTVPANCAPVENLAITSVRHNMVTFTWNRNPFGTESMWEVGIVDDSTNVMQTSDTVAVLFGLSEGRQYTLYVKALCDEAETSVMATLAFTTSAAPLPCVEIGTGTTTSNTTPFNNYYKNGWSQAIYTAAEIGRSGALESIWYHCSDAVGHIDSVLTIYMAHTSKAVAETTTDWIPMADIVQVYKAEPFNHPLDSGWFEIPLQVPFQYNGTDNLAIMISHHADSYSSGQKYYCSTVPEGAVMYRQSDTDASTGEYPTSGSTGTKLTSRANAMFCFESEACGRPADLTISDVTYSTARASWVPGSNERSWETYLSTTPMTDAELDSISTTVVTTPLMMFNDLTDDVDYWFYARGLCNATHTSKWASVHFVTPAMCLAPAEIHADSTTSNMAWVTLTDVNVIEYNSPSYIIAYGPANHFDLKNTATYLTTQVNDTNAVLTNLQHTTMYAMAARIVCDETHTSRWSPIGYFQTDCGIISNLPWSEDFNMLTSGIPQCWDNSLGTTTTASYRWNYNANGISGACVRFNSYGNSMGKTNTLMTPEIHLDTVAELSFAYKNATGGAYNVGITTDNGVNVTTVLTGLMSADWNEAVVNLSAYVGQTFRICFMGTSNNGSGDAYLYLDDILVAVPSPCLRPVIVKANAGNGTVDLAWSGLATATYIVERAENVAFTGEIDSTTVVNDTTLFVTGLEDNTTYYFRVRAFCGEIGDSPLSAIAKVRLGTGLPMGPDYDNMTTFPNDWSRSNTLASDVFNGTPMATYSGGWTRAAGNAVMPKNHFKLNIYGANCKYWLLTPVMNIASSSGEDVLLTFDLMLCDFGNPGSPADPVGDDDFFMVVISDDGGQTWKRQNATVWRNTADADYNYSALPYNDVITYRFNLAAYMGKAIQIGFYGESTVTGGDNDLHLGNVRVAETVINELNDFVCQGQPYSGNGFVVNPDEYVVGENHFDIFTAGTATTPDVYTDLELTVLPVTTDTLFANVCEGAAYVYDEHIYLEEGDVTVGRQEFLFELTSIYGCDSVVLLIVNGMPASRATEYASTCSGIPYRWHGQDYYIGGTYVDTLRTIDGCDSICTLLLTVEDVIRRDTAVTLCYGEQLIINGQTITTSGVYTESIDNPEGCDEQINWYVTAIGKLETHTRVVTCKGTTYSDELIHGLTQDFHGNTTTTSKVSGCDSTVIYDIWFADANETLYVNVPENELPFVVNGVELISAGTAQGEYTRTVSTTCGDVTMVIAVGQAIIRYTVTVKAGNGMPYGGGVYVAGEQVEIGVRPFDGYEFKTWNDGNKENPRTIIVNADVTYTGTCEEIEEGLEDVIRDMNEDDVLKLIENQQLIIIRGGVRYNAQGAVME